MLTIWTKELRDTLRDRRTLWAMIVMPVLIMPVMILGIGYVAKSEARMAQEHVARVAIFGREFAPELAALLAENTQLDIIYPARGDAPETLVREEKVEVSMVVPPDFEQLLDEKERVEIPAYFNSTRNLSQAGLAKLRYALSGFTDDVVAQRLVAVGLDTQILSGVTAKMSNVATEREVGGFILSFMLPMFLVMWAIVGGMYTAIDVSAGEKERKTLETLLLTPVSRLQVVMGKFLAVLTTSLVSVVLALTSLVVSFKFGLAREGGIAIGFDAATVLLMLIVGFLLSCMFSALLLAVSIFAKSFKEAQNYVTPLYVVAILPMVFLNVLPNYKPSSAVFLVPAFNAMLLFKEMLLGKTQVAHVVITIISLAVAAGITIGIATRIFNKESVLFRD